MGCAEASEFERPGAKCWPRTRQRVWSGGCRVSWPMQGSPTRFCRCNNWAVRLFEEYERDRPSLCPLAALPRGRKPREPIMAITASEFDYIRRLVLEQSAIVLEQDKQYLAESRLLPLARREGFDSLASLVVGLAAKRFDGLHRKVVEAMTTNETSFFRDFHPFEALRNSILPELIAKRASSKELNFWSAA